jgi:flagellar motor switch protein FliM
MIEETAEPLLSSDETEALLAAMRNGAANAQSARELELGSTDQRLRQSLERADAVGKDFAIELRKMLRRVTGVSHLVREGSADVVPFNVFASSTVQGTAIGTLKLAGKVVGFVVLGPRVTVRVLSRRLGGAVPAADAPEEEPRLFLSPVDRRVARPFLTETLELFNAFWGGEELALELGDVLARAADLPKLTQFEPLLRLPMQIGISPDQSEEMCVVLTSAAVPSVSAAPAPEPAAPPISNEDRARLAARLAQAEVEVVAVLGHARSTVRDVLRLNVGDVIRLDEPPDAPIRVSVEGRQKLFGLPVVRHGNLAIEVIRVLKGAP